MSTAYQESITEKYRKALEMKTSLEVMNGLSRRRVSKLENCYDIQWIRKGFQSYFQNIVSKEYFLKWCNVYALLIRASYKVKTREDLAYDAIVDLLQDVAESGVSPIKALAEIEIHNEVLEGKREAEYWLATDCEFFYVDLNKRKGGYDLVDCLEINHRRKTYDVLRGVSDLITDGCDMLGNYIDSVSVSRIVFESICKGIAMMGYKNVKEGNGYEK